jgi:hypothetical protein
MRLCAGSDRLQARGDAAINRALGLAAFVGLSIPDLLASRAPLRVALSGVLLAD